MSEKLKAEIDVLKLDAQIKRVKLSIMKEYLDGLRGKNPVILWETLIAIVVFAIVFGVIVKFAI